MVVEGSGMTGESLEGSKRMSVGILQPKKTFSLVYPERNEIHIGLAAFDSLELSRVHLNFARLGVLSGPY